MAPTLMVATGPFGAPEPSVDGDLPRRLYRVLSSWHFKRHRSPQEEQAIAVIAGAVARAEAPQLVGYWGCGDRDHLGTSDEQALDRLGLIAAHVRDVWPPGLAIVLVLADAHAWVNGKNPATIARYLGCIREAAAARGFSTVFLLDLWHACGFSLADLDRRRVSPEEVPARLAASAARHARNVPPALAAARYLAACGIDGEVIDRSFPDGLFFTYNGRDYASYLPPLPKIYLYSMRKGTTAKPWFSP